MSNGGIIGPVNDPTRADVTTTFTASGTVSQAAPKSAMAAAVEDDEMF